MTARDDSRRARGARRLTLRTALLCLSLGAGCSDEPAGTDELPSIFAGGADQVMLGVEHYLTQGGVRRGIMRADTAFTYEDDSRIELRSLEIRFFDEAGSDRGILTADSGVYDLLSGDMTVWGNVELEARLEAPEPYRLETDSLVYMAPDILTTESRYTLTRPDGTVERGVGLTTNPSLTSFQRSEFTITTPDVEVPE